MEAKESACLGNVTTERRGGTWSPTPTGTATHDDDDDEIIGEKILVS